MKGIVDEGENVAVIYIDGKAATKYARAHEAEEDAKRMRTKFPNKKIEVKQEMREDVQLDENLHKWFKEKWVRFGPDGKIRGACARGSDSEGKPKCLPQSKAHSIGKKGRKYAASKKRREDPNPDRHGPAHNVATKKKTNEEMMDENCWKGYHKEGNKKMFGKTVPNCVKNEDQELDEKWSAKYKRSIDCSHPKGFSQKAHCAGRKKNEDIQETQQCPECGGAMYHESMLNEKQDACYYKVKSRYKVWPSAYASGALVQCRKKGAKNWGTKSESVEEAANPAQQAAIAINMKKHHKKPKNEAKGTPGGVEMFRTPAMVNATMQQSLYKKDLDPIKRAENLAKQKAYRDANPKEPVQNIHIGAGAYPISVLQNWMDNKDINSVMQFAINKFGNKQSKEFKAELASDPKFKEAFVNLLDVGAGNLAARNAYMAKRGVKTPDTDYRTAEQTQAGYDAVNRINDILLSYYKKYGVDKTGRRVPPGYNYNLEEGVIVGHDAKDPEVAILGGAGTMSLSRLKKKAHGEATALANDISKGSFKAAAYNIKQLANTLNTIAAAEEEMAKRYFVEAMDWQQGNNNVQHDHTFFEAMEYLKHIYPIVKQYLIRRAEVGFRAVKSLDYLSSADPMKHLDDKQFLKSMSNMKNVDAVIKYLNLNRLSIMSGSKQVSASIGYTWTTFLSPKKDFGVIYYQDRGMGQDMIVIGAKDNATHRKVYDVFVDAGVIVGREKKIKEPELPKGMRVSGAASRDDAYNRAMNKFLGNNDDDGVNEDYTGEFAAEKTPAVNPYGGLKDRKFRGAISEGIALSEMPDTSGAVGVQPGGWRTYKSKSAGVSESRYTDDIMTFAKDLNSEMRRERYDWEYVDLGDLEEAIDDASEQLSMFAHSNMCDAFREYDLEDQIKLIKAFNKKAVKNEDTSYAGGMGQGHSGESYRKFTPKSAGTFKKESAIMKGLKR